MSNRPVGWLKEESHLFSEAERWERQFRHTQQAFFATIAESPLSSRIKPMIREVKIQNYKSIENLDLELGRINVLIGENGCGKTNILEAIALASAAYSNKLDNEFLVSRGIRVTAPQLMRSAFDKENVDKDISIKIILNDFKSFELLLKNNNKLYSQWFSETFIEYPEYNIKKSKDNAKEDLSRLFETFKVPDNVLESLYERLKLDISKELAKEEILNLIKPYLPKNREKFEQDIKNFKIKEVNELFSKMEKILGFFLVFFPDSTSLRIFEREGQIQPLGIHGEGLFKFLRFLDMQEDKIKFNEIKERLRLISWFKDFEIPKDLFETERKIYITDKYLDRDLKYFDQRSSNEGFLFTLFYLTLFVGEETPKFFAIDNIDNALNPKLCWRVIEELVELAKKYDKQAIFTTHNPAILDGLDLDDDEQRLFVVSRNRFGRTRAKRIFSPKKIEGQEPLELSEAFMRGYIGGMPKHF